MKHTKTMRRRDGVIQRYHLSVKPIKLKRPMKAVPYQIPINVHAIKPKLIYKDAFGNKLFAQYRVGPENVAFVAQNARGQPVDDRGLQYMVQRAKSSRRMRTKMRMKK
jgi:hypothetical protein